MKHTSAKAAAPENFTDVLVRDGYAFVPAVAMRVALAQSGPLSDWQDFADSWDDLMPDTYLADKGRYRLRRHATFAAMRDSAIERRPHQAHFQSLDYNRLHGGI